MKHASIKNYQDAKDFLQGKKSRPYAHNTRIVMDTLNMGHDVITVTYHDNPVVNFFPDGTNTYSSCGWKTITTKERINWFLPNGFAVYQEKSVWYLSHRHWSDTFGRVETGKWIFADGIAIKDGAVFNAGTEDNTQKTIKTIKKYVDGYIQELLSGKMESPSGGDCWYCLMTTQDGQSLGDATKNNEHILSHLEESYYVPSLLYRAYEHNRRMCPIAMSTVAQLWQGDTVSEWQKDITSRDVRSCLTAYLKHQLNIAQ